MIEQELILLGLLKERPKHGYEIMKQIREILSVFAGVDVKSIYYPLRVLEKQGLVVKRKHREGKRPAKFVYELTPAGEERFRQLLSGSFLDLTRPQFSLDLSLFFLPYIPAELARRRLRARTLILDRLSRNLRQMIVSLPKRRPESLVHILEHNLAMVQTEAKFLGRIVASLPGEEPAHPRREEAH